MVASPNTAMATTLAAATAPASGAGASAPTKTVPIRIKVGQRPLQTLKLLVMIAIRRSRGCRSPASRSPRRVAAETHHQRQRLLAVRSGAGEQPIEIESDPRQIAQVLQQGEQGKKIAIGGSITATTHAVAR